MTNRPASVMPATAAKPIHGTPAPVNVPADMQTVPPVPCRFAVGEIVEHTNANGLKHPVVVRGFTRTVSDAAGNGFIYLDWDAWWFPVRPDCLTPLSEVAPDSDTFRYKWRTILADRRRVLIDAATRTVTPAQ